MYVAQSTFAGSLLGHPLSQPMAFFSLRQAEHKYRMVKGWPFWDPAAAFIHEDETYSGGVWLESDDDSHPPFIVLIQVSRYCEPITRSVLITTETEYLAIWENEQAANFRLAFASGLGRSKLLMKDISKATLTRGLFLWRQPFRSTIFRGTTMVSELRSRT